MEHHWLTIRRFNGVVCFWACSLAALLGHIVSLSIGSNLSAAASHFALSDDRSLIAAPNLGNFQWYNLNSTLPQPRVLSDTYMTLYLAQLEHEGLS